MFFGAENSAKSQIEMSRHSAARKEEPCWSGSSQYLLPSGKRNSDHGRYESKWWKLEPRNPVSCYSYIVIAFEARKHGDTRRVAGVGKEIGDLTTKMESCVAENRDTPCIVFPLPRKKHHSLWSPNFCNPPYTAKYGCHDGFLQYW